MTMTHMSLALLAWVILSIPIALFIAAWTRVGSGGESEFEAREDHQRVDRKAA